jgi:hypothetical protein
MRGMISSLLGAFMRAIGTRFGLMVHLIHRKYGIGEDRSPNERGLSSDFRSSLARMACVWRGWVFLLLQIPNELQMTPDCKLMSEKLKDLLANVVSWIGFVSVLISIIPLILLMTPFLAWRWANERLSKKHAMEKKAGVESLYTCKNRPAYSNGVCEKCGKSWYDG